MILTNRNRTRDSDDPKNNQKTSIYGSGLQHTSIMTMSIHNSQHWQIQKNLQVSPQTNIIPQFLYYNDQIKNAKIP